MFKELAGDFERASGHKLIIRYGTIGGITQRILGGEDADLVIGSILLRYLNSRYYRPKVAGPPC